jgi:hypothetical protein
MKLKNRIINIRLQYNKRASENRLVLIETPTGAIEPHRSYKGLGS